MKSNRLSFRDETTIPIRSGWMVQVTMRPIAVTTTISKDTVVRIMNTNLFVFIFLGDFGGRLFGVAF